MENLSAFFHRIRANEDERQFVFRDLVLRAHLVRAFDTTDDGLLTGNDGSSEWFDADSISQPENTLKAIVIRQSDGDATDSPYSLLLQIMAHMRKCANGLCPPDWDGLLCHAYITPEYEQEWEEAAAEIDSNPFRLPSDDSAVEEWLAKACPMAIASQIAKEIDADISRDKISEYLANGSFINWNYWVVKMPVLTAAQAARLMAGLDPDVFESLDSRPNKFNPSPLCSRAKSMERTAVAQQLTSQSPAKWLEWAVAHPFEVHAPFRDAVQSKTEASQVDEASLPSDDLPNQFGYTIRGAAIAIAREYEVPEKAMRDHIFKAAEKGELAVIDPQTGMPYAPEVRRDFYERIRIDDLNKWFKECGVAYRLEQYVATNSADAPQSLATGLGKKEILSVDWPLINFSNEALAKAMSDTNNAKWLLDAMAMRGKRGPNGSALWNPAMLGVCLIARGYAKKSAITRHIAARFPDWVVEWEEKAERL